MKSVKCCGAPGKNPPKPVNKAVFDGQGSISYAKTTDVATPNTAKGSSVSGTKRGMGAALRGSRFNCC
jgi:hypothetical protein